MDTHSTKKLNDGHSLPLLGIGTWQMHESGEVEPAVLDALLCGYRHIDTAQMYDNEEGVGRAIKKSGIPRSEIFVTTKVYEGDPLHEVQASLKRLGLEYVDLYLLHWPLPSRHDIWKQFIEFQKKGLCRSIGVSNFTVEHLKELRKFSSVIPAVNQVEFTPFLYQKELLEYCTKNTIVLEAYSPLARGHKFDDPTISKIALRHKKSPAQIMIRWCLQHDVVVLPKSKLKKRIVENADVFDFVLSSDEMQLLNGLSDGTRYCWNPTDVK